MGELRVSRERIDLPVLVWLTFHLVDYTVRNGYASEAESPELAGHLAAAVVREIQYLGIPLPLNRCPMATVTTAEENGHVVFAFQAQPNRCEHSVRLLLGGHADLFEMSGYGSPVGDVVVDPEHATLDTIVEQVFRAIVALRGLQKGVKYEDAARICAQIVAGVCAYLRRRKINNPDQNIKTGSPRPGQVDATPVVIIER
jgi:hypothetical protein